MVAVALSTERKVERSAARTQAGQTPNVGAESVPKASHHPTRQHGGQAPTRGPLDDVEAALYPGRPYASLTPAERNHAVRTAVDVVKAAGQWREATVQPTRGDTPKRDRRTPPDAEPGWHARGGRARTAKLRPIERQLIAMAGGDARAAKRGTCE